MPQHSDHLNRTKTLSEDLNSILYKFAHEPSLAGHRVQEHVYKTVPGLVRDRKNINDATRKLDGTLFDLNYTNEFLTKLDESIHTSRATREYISELASKVSHQTSRTSNP